MGVITGILGTLFGGGLGDVRKTIEVFRPNAEAADQRDSGLDAKTIEQLAAEFSRAPRGRFDALVDGLNRLPRPLLVLGIVALLVWTAVDPLATTRVFVAWSLIPEPVWAIIGIVIAFYFGGRHQVKNLEFARSMAATAARAPEVLATLGRIEEMRHDSPLVAEADPAELDIDDHNPALAEWRTRTGKTGPSATR